MEKTTTTGVRQSTQGVLTADVHWGPVRTERQAAGHWMRAISSPDTFCRGAQTLSNLPMGRARSQDSNLGRLAYKRKEKSKLTS